jgi:hypothetical protein
VVKRHHYDQAVEMVPAAAKIIVKRASGAEYLRSDAQSGFGRLATLLNRVANPQKAAHRPATFPFPVWCFHGRRLLVLGICNGGPEPQEPGPWYPHPELNRDQRFRKPLLYPFELWGRARMKLSTRARCDKRRNGHPLSRTFQPGTGSRYRSRVFHHGFPWFWKSPVDDSPFRSDCSAPKFRSAPDRAAPVFMQ